MPERGPTLSIRARGPLAIFTRPELKTERVSYPVPTPSAMRGLIEAVFWKPAIRWHVERIFVLAPIHFIAFRRNEINNKGAAPTREIVENGGAPPVYFADDSSNRAQRNTIALRDVDYQVDAHFSLTEHAGAEDNIYKFIDMFTRRVEKGQHFHQPYLGCRECAAEILPPLDDPQPITDSRDLGRMLWDIDFAAKSTTPLFFEAKMENGVIEVPLNPLPEEVTA